MSRLITGDAGLVTACERWSAAGAIGIDTEFVRERTYHPRPGLIQVADRDGVAMIDPLELSDFGPLAALLTDASVVKLMHACDEDLDVLELLTGVAPRGVVDTQLAGAFAGYGYSLSYSSLVEMLFEVVLDKGHTRSDWLRRPLSSGQLHYAALDVVYLLPLHERLSREMAALGRLSWLEEEREHRRRTRAIDRQPEAAYRRVRRRHTLRPADHAVLRALSEWRESEAAARDIPRRHLLTDDVLIALASAPTCDAASCDAQEGLWPGIRTRYGQAIMTCIDAARAQGPIDADAFVDLRPHAATFARLKEIVKQEADARRLPPELIASRRALEMLLSSVIGGGEIPPQFQGWRYDVVTEALVACIRGPSEAPEGP